MRVRQSVSRSVDLTTYVRVFRLFVSRFNKLSLHPLSNTAKSSFFLFFIFYFLVSARTKLLNELDPRDYCQMASILGILPHTPVQGIFRVYTRPAQHSDR